MTRIRILDSRLASLRAAASPGPLTGPPRPGPVPVTISIGSHLRSAAALGDDIMMRIRIPDQLACAILRAAAGTGPLTGPQPSSYRVDIDIHPGSALRSTTPEPLRELQESGRGSSYYYKQYYHKPASPQHGYTCASICLCTVVLAPEQH